MVTTHTNPLITQAFILGAGKGTRMAPLTDHMPKPMVPLDGRPLIDHVIERLKQVGVQKFIVNVHHLADQLEAHLKSYNDPNIIISDEREQLLDTGGGLIKASTHLDRAPFFIHNSDSVWLEDEAYENSNLARMVTNFDPNKMETLMLLADRKKSLGYEGKGDFVLNESNIVQRRPDTTPSDYVFAGVSIAHPSLLDGAPQRTSLGTSLGAFSLNKLWDAALQKHTAFGLKHHGLWMHVGTPQALSDAQERINQANLNS